MCQGDSINVIRLFDKKTLTLQLNQDGSYLARLSIHSLFMSLSPHPFLFFPSIPLLPLHLAPHHLSFFFSPLFSPFLPLPCILDSSSFPPAPHSLIFSSLISYLTLSPHPPYFFFSMVEMYKMPHHPSMHLSIQAAFELQHISILLWVNVLIRKVDEQAIDVEPGKTAQKADRSHTHKERTELRKTTEFLLHSVFEVLLRTLTIERLATMRRILSTKYQFSVSKTCLDLSTIMYRPVRFCTEQGSQLGYTARERQYRSWSAKVSKVTGRSPLTPFSPWQQTNLRWACDFKVTRVACNVRKCSTGGNHVGQSVCAFTTASSELSGVIGRRKAE